MHSTSPSIDFDDWIEKIKMDEGKDFVECTYRLSMLAEMID